MLKSLRYVSTQESFLQLMNFGSFFQTSSVVHFGKLTNSTAKGTEDKNRSWASRRKKKLVWMKLIWRNVKSKAKKGWMRGRSEIEDEVWVPINRGGLTGVLGISMGIDLTTSALPHRQLTVSDDLVDLSPSPFSFNALVRRWRWYTYGDEASCDSEPSRVLSPRYRNTVGAPK